MDYNIFFAMEAMLILPLQHIHGVGYNLMVEISEKSFFFFKLHAKFTFDPNL